MIPRYKNGRNKGQIKQSVLQTGNPNGTFKRGDNHPNRGFNGCYFRGYINGQERWTTKDRLSYIKQDSCGYYKRVKKTDHYQNRIKAYYSENLGKIKKYTDNWYQENKQRISDRDKNNRDRINKRIKNRANNDVSFKISIRLRGRLREAIKRSSGKKAYKTKELIGCEITHVINHLESQFTEGMSWDNYGEWHIDHIIPCAFFDLTKPSHQKVCFNWQNLQPLWESDNCAKGDKIPWYVLLTILMNNYKTITV
jgi:hypothetical protein